VTGLRQQLIKSTSPERGSFPLDHEGNFHRPWCLWIPVEETVDRIVPATYQLEETTHCHETLLLRMGQVHGLTIYRRMQAPYFPVSEMSETEERG
jgi:hypothetical protein